MAGNIGNIVGNTNIQLFGYLAYINVLLLLVPIYKLFRNPKLLKDIEFYAGWILLFVSILILPALVLDSPASGRLSDEISSFFLPYIGKVGMWLFWLMTMLLSLVLIVDDDFFYNMADTFRDSRENISIPKPSLGSLGGKIKSVSSQLLTPNYDDIVIAPMPEKQKIAPKPKRAKKITQKSNRQIKQKSPKEDEDPIVVEILEREEVAEDATKDSHDSVDTATIANHATEVVEELEENSKLLDELEKGEMAKPKNFKLPKVDFLKKPPRASRKINEAEIDRKIGELLDKLGRFKIEGDVVRTYSGPLVTTFEFKPAPNVKVSKILGLQDDLAMALSAETIRIQAPIPGRNVVGIEIPNESFDTIYLRDIFESKLFKESKSPLTIALGKDIVGKPFITDLKKLPHLLIAGTTGSGKSVGINAMILSLLYRNDPDSLKMILIDPKMLEFSIYNDIPHLLTPVIIEPKKAIAALANMVLEMERRYKLMALNKVKNIDGYNEKMKKTGEESMPFIVIVIDELADLMMNGGKEVEYSIARLAQMARASGIHLIIATQRPSVDVVTGLIKANLPSRLSYRVGQRIDSKVILDSMGAESLLGRGDALFTPPSATGLVRLHAPWNSEQEIDKIVDFLKAQREPEYDESYLEASGSDDMLAGDSGVELDALYEKAKEVVLTDRKTSISYLQRKLQIGYNRSANIIDQLEKTGILSPPNNKGNRDIL